MRARSLKQLFLISVLALGLFIGSSALGAVVPGSDLERGGQAVDKQLTELLAQLRDVFDMGALEQWKDSSCYRDQMANLTDETDSLYGLVELVAQLQAAGDPIKTAEAANYAVLGLCVRMLEECGMSEVDREITIAIIARLQELGFTSVAAEAYHKPGAPLGGGFAFSGEGFSAPGGDSGRDLTTDTLIPSSDDPGGGGGSGGGGSSNNGGGDDSVLAERYATDYGGTYEVSYAAPPPGQPRVSVSPGVTPGATDPIGLAYFMQMMSFDTDFFGLPLDGAIITPWGYFEVGEVGALYAGDIVPLAQVAGRPFLMTPYFSTSSDLFKVTYVIGGSVVLGQNAGGLVLEGGASFATGTVYQNGWISFAYGDLDGTLNGQLVAGLWDDYNADFLSIFRNGAPALTGQAFANHWSNKFVIFRPNGQGGYDIIYAGRHMLASSHSLDEAILATTQNEDLNDLIETGYYQNDEIQAKLPQDVVDRIQADKWLAYAVQLEEDTLNQQIMAMHREMVGSALRDEIDNLLDKGLMRERDAFLEQQSDAQAGRVARDKDGNWVRTQQYVLRPSKDSVQVVSVSLREHGRHAGMSLIDYRTYFDDDFTGDLQSLPWDLWTDTQGSGLFNLSDRHVLTDPNAPVQMESSSIKLQNPGGEYLMESREFAYNSPARLDITLERLTLNSNLRPGAETFNFGLPLTPSTYMTIPVQGGFMYFGMDSVGGPVGFTVIATRILDGYTDTGVVPLNSGDWTPKDLWAAMVWDGDAVMPANTMLELTVDDNMGTSVYFENPIDVVLVPMSRMDWD